MASTLSSVSCIVSSCGIYHLHFSRMAAERLAWARKLRDCCFSRGHRSQAGWSTASPGMGHQAIETRPLRESLCVCSGKAQHHVYLQMTSLIMLHSLSCLLSCSRSGTLGSIEDKQVSDLQPYAPADTSAQQYQLLKRSSVSFCHRQSGNAQQQHVHCLIACD